MYKNKLSWNITNKEIKNIRERKYKQFTTYPTPPRNTTTIILRTRMNNGVKNNLISELQYRGNITNNH